IHRQALFWLKPSLIDPLLRHLDWPDGGNTIRAFSRPRGSAVVVAWQSPAQIVNEPATGAAGRMSRIVNNMERNTGEAAIVFLQVKALETAGIDVLGHEVQRHMAPTETGQEIVETIPEIGEAPDARADDARAHGRAERRSVGQDQLYVALENIVAKRAGFGGQRVISGDDRHERDRCEELRLQSLSPGRVRRVDR